MNEPRQKNLLKILNFSGKVPKQNKKPIKTEIESNQDDEYDKLEQPANINLAVEHGKAQLVNAIKDENELESKF